MVYRVSSPPKTFNYLLANEAVDLNGVLPAQQPACGVRSFDANLRAWPRGTWTTGADRRSVDIRLRDGLKFSDGQPLTSSDVAFTLEATYDERNKAVFRDALLINGKPISVKVIDDRNLQFVFPETIAAPDNYLYNIAVLPRNALEADQKAGRFPGVEDNGAADIRDLERSVRCRVSSGRRTDRPQTQSLLLETGHRTQLPYLDELTLEVVPDANQARVGLDQATIDIVDRIRPTDYASLLNAGGAVSLRSRSESWGRLYLVQSESPSRTARG